ncbi:MAG: hypothetical protein ACLTBV_07665 [Enterocloster bolteae]
MGKYIVGITGASGSIYAKRVIEEADSERPSCVYLHGPGRKAGGGV